MLRLLVNMRLSKGCKRLYIQQPSSSSSDSEEEQEWDKYKIKDNNMFTVDKYQQINIFPNEKVFALRYQTAGMLETVLRQGVLGEDDIGEEFPKNLKLPSRRPAIVCETCLFSLKKDMRARAFHIMDSKGIIEMIHIFLEERGGEVLIVPSLDDSNVSQHLRLYYNPRSWKKQNITKIILTNSKSELDVDYVSIPIIHIDQDSDATMVQVSFGDRLGALIDTNDNIVIDNIL